MLVPEITAVAWEDADIIIQLPGFLQGFNTSLGFSLIEVRQRIYSL